MITVCSSGSLVQLALSFPRTFQGPHGESPWRQLDSCASVPLWAYHGNVLATVCDTHRVSPTIFFCRTPLVSLYHTHTITMAARTFSLTITVSWIATKNVSCETHEELSLLPLIIYLQLPMTWNPTPDKKSLLVTHRPGVFENCNYLALCQIWSKYHYKW